MNATYSNRRKDSLNRQLAKSLIAIAQPKLQLEIVEIGGLPLFDQDFEADAILVATPEYNRSC